MSRKCCPLYPEGYKQFNNPFPSVGDQYAEDHDAALLPFGDGHFKLFLPIRRASSSAQAMDHDTVDDGFLCLFPFDIDDEGEIAFHDYVPVVGSDPFNSGASSGLLSNYMNTLTINVPDPEGGPSKSTIQPMEIWALSGFDRQARSCVLETGNFCAQLQTYQSSLRLAAVPKVGNYPTIASDNVVILSAEDIFPEEVFFGLDLEAGSFNQQNCGIYQVDEGKVAILFGGALPDDWGTDVLAVVLMEWDGFSWSQPDVTVVEDGSKKLYMDLDAGAVLSDGSVAFISLDYVTAEVTSDFIPEYSLFRVKGSHVDSVRIDVEDYEYQWNHEKAAIIDSGRTGELYAVCVPSTPGGIGNQMDVIRIATVESGMKVESRYPVYVDTLWGILAANHPKRFLCNGLFTSNGTAPSTLESFNSYIVGASETVHQQTYTDFSEPTPSTFAYYLYIANTKQLLWSNPLGLNMGPGVRYVTFPYLLPSCLDVSFLDRWLTWAPQP